MTHSAFIDLDDTVYAPIREARAQWLAAREARKACHDESAWALCLKEHDEEERAYRRSMHATQEYRPGAGVATGGLIHESC